ncbi:MAG: HlyD family efflux transporter periplasmic adaptor subunit [Dehalococcoidia bacterium]|nr:HlyD family efflux transporter periplasmic adaptor subunit [Dehalococcoidia bacterium]
MKRSPRALTYLALAVPAILLIAATACGGSGGSAQASDTQTGAVQRGNLLIAVSTTGTVSLPIQSKLTFSGSGAVTDVLVGWGQEVMEGQVLARMDDTFPKAALIDAQLNLMKAQKAVTDYQDQFSPDQVATARNTVSNAKTSVLQAQNSLDAYRDSFTPLVVAKAQSAFGSAQVGVAQAEKALTDYQDMFSQGNGNKLRTAVDEARLSALIAQNMLRSAKQDTAGNPVYDARVRADAAGATMRDAQVALDAANNDLAVAGTDWALRQVQSERQVTVAETTYRDRMLATYRIALNRPDLLQRPPEAYVNPDTIIPTSVLDAWNALTDQRTNYSILLLQKEKALAAAQNTAAKVDDAFKAARRARDEAIQALQTATAAEPARLRGKELDIDRANLAVVDAQAVLSDPVQLRVLRASFEAAKVKAQDAQKTLDDAMSGADPKQLVILQASVDSAKARVQEAETAFAKVLAGPEPVEKASRDNAVASSKLRLQQAKNDLDRAVLKAPFTGAVSAVGVAVGDTVGANTVAVTMVDNRTFEVTVSVDEIDLPKIKVGQLVALTSDASPSLRGGGVVKAIAPIARVQQGVASYDVLLSLQAPGNQGAGSQGAGNQSAGGQRIGGLGAGGQAAGNQGAASQRASGQGTGGQGAGNAGASVPSLRGGMTLNAQIVVENKQDVLLVPLRAVQTSAGSRTVNVMENGVATAKKITIGSSNQQFAEVMDGLSEGDKVVIPARATTTQQQQLRLPGGIVPGGGAGSFGR